MDSFAKVIAVIMAICTCVIAIAVATLIILLVIDLYCDLFHRKTNSAATIADEIRKAINRRLEQSDSVFR